MIYGIHMAAASSAGAERVAFGNFAYISLALAVTIVVICLVLLLKISKQEEKLRDIERAEKGIEEELGRVRADNQSLIQTIQSSFHTFGEMVSSNQRMGAESQDKRLADLNARFSNMAVENEQKLENIRTAMEKRLGELTADNNRQLEQMRRTVDEKLQKTLEDRIGQSFRLVSERLEQVYKGLGEMQNLAVGVGDLKKVLSNVKTRGILGEVQLGAILEQILAPEQYAENVCTKPTGSERVEFAVKLPGASSGGGLRDAYGQSLNRGENRTFAAFEEAPEQVWLPIDAKFPGDTYSKLMEAYESGDAQRVEEAAKALEKAVRAEAKDIRNKYVEPPYTTDFAIMFLPFEGLYAEVVRRGMVEALQREYKVNIAGPTTMAALLNSLQMGFKTLAIQKHSGEVWNVLGAVKTEFDKFGDALKATQNRINQANAELDKLVGVRTRSIQKTLKGVVSLGEGAGMGGRLLSSEEPLGEGDGFGGFDDLNASNITATENPKGIGNDVVAGFGGLSTDFFTKLNGGGEL